jgi:alkylation response protein AidB-like acyl-CoA dehydrogenase
VVEVEFAFNTDQETIRQTARDFLAARYDSGEIRRLADDARGFTDEQWSELAGLGWPGIFVSEDDGGQGLGVLELAILQEQLGYALAPVPFFSAVAAGLVLQAAAEDEQRRRFLAPVAAGELRATLAVEGDISADSEGTVSGTAIVVPDAASADLLVVAESGAGQDGDAGVDHYVVPAGGDGVSITATPGLDPTRKLYEVRFDRARGEWLRGDASSAYPKIITALAGESTGISQRAMEMAVAYAKDRRQFGTPIGAFQAISHQCAEMLLLTESARSAVYYAAWCLDHQPESGPLAASMAKAYASDAAVRTAGAALQVHGGIGFTWEHDIHLFLRRAQANAHAFGDSGWHRARIAAYLEERVADGAS